MTFANTNQEAFEQQLFEKLMVKCVRLRTLVYLLFFLKIYLDKSKLIKKI